MEPPSYTSLEMSAKKLTALTVDRAHRKEKPIVLNDGDGLYFRKQTGRGASWTLRYKLVGRARWMALGNYPDMTLVEARKEARKARVQLDQGLDPLDQRRAARESLLQRGTFGELAEDWFGTEIKGRVKHTAVPRRHLEKYLLPAIGRLRANEVRAGDIVRLLEKVRRTAPTTANDVLRTVSRVFAFGVRRQAVLLNPAAGLSPKLDGGGTEVARTRWLRREELDALFRAMRKAPAFSGANTITIKLLLALCVRKGELLAARWSEFDLVGETSLGPVWRLPGQRTKTGEPLNIPLPPQVVEWLRTLNVIAARSEFVFPKRRRDRRSRLEYVGVDTINAALKNLDHGLKPFTVHDLRRTARTHLAELGVTSEVAERCLGHKLTGVQGTYNVHDYFAERRAALQLWVSLLDEIEQGNLDVTPIRTT